MPTSTATRTDPLAALRPGIEALDAERPGWREAARAWEAERWDALLQQAAEDAERCRRRRAGLLGDAPEGAVAGAAEFAEGLASGRWRGAWVWGPCGTGKTAWARAAAMAWEALPGGRTSAVLGAAGWASRLNAALRPYDPKGDPVRVAAEFLAPGLLVLDDLDKAAWVQQGAASVLYECVNRRWADGRPTVVTANASPSQWAEAVSGERFPAATAASVVDRLKQGARLVERTGRSMRGGWSR